MHCPHCQPLAAAAYRAHPERARGIPLAPLRYEADIEVQHCAECDGLWLEEGQLVRIQNTREHDYSHVSPVDVALRHRHREPLEPLPCPRCRTDMWPMTYKTSSVPYLACLACGGTWIERAALQDIEAYWESYARR